MYGFGGRLRPSATGPRSLEELKEQQFVEGEETLRSLQPPALCGGHVGLRQFQKVWCLLGFTGGVWGMTMTGRDHHRGGMREVLDLGGVRGP